MTIILFVVYCFLLLQWYHGCLINKPPFEDAGAVVVEGFC